MTVLRKMRFGCYKKYAEMPTDLSSEALETDLTLGWLG
ncbi:Undefined function [Listeria monocytogenes]|nr:Undefined function [Listeria monocytogenes]